MWTTEVRGESTAAPAEVFAILAETSTWSEWNEGVAGIRMSGPFETGTAAVMVFPDASELPFRLAWVEEGRGFEDVTDVPDSGVTVRVRHELEAIGTGTGIVYRCTVEGPDGAAKEVGAAVSADFAEVIAALASRAERMRA